MEAKDSSLERNKLERGREGERRGEMKGGEGESEKEGLG